MIHNNAVRKDSFWLCLKIDTLAEWRIQAKLKKLNKVLINSR